MSRLPEARQDSRGRQVNLAPHANYIHIPMGDGLCVSAQLPLPFIVCRDEYKKKTRQAPRGSRLTGAKEIRWGGYPRDHFPPLPQPPRPSEPQPEFYW